MMLAGAALGAGAGLDRTAFGQTLFAHPAVVGAAAMGIAGPTLDAALFLGVLTSLDATQIPVGPVRRRDFSSAAVFGVLLGAEVGGPSGWALVLLASLAVATIGGWTVALVREIAARSVPAVDRAIGRGDLRSLERLHLGLTLLHPLRGAAVVVCALAGLRPLIQMLTDAAQRNGSGDYLALIWMLAPWAALPVLCRLHWERRRPWAFGGGAIIAILVFWVQTHGGPV